jgi:hypothetical protein
MASDSSRLRRAPRRQEAKLAFEALAIEGGLLAPEWLAKVAQMGAGGQSEADYRIPRGLNVRDELGRFWRVAQAHWADFAAGRAAGSDARALAERFVPALLREVFGFTSLTTAPPAVIADRSYPIGWTALSGTVPVVVAPAGLGLDTLSPGFGEGGRRRSAFGLVQEHLNAADGAKWGLATDGLTLRIVRDNASLTRPAWIEADLQQIFTEQRYADFAALWLLLHETRFGVEGKPAAECPLETWRAAGRDQGTRAREHLRRGVEDALTALGQGFVSHPDNGPLRAALSDGVLTSAAYFNELLRLVYRVIFLLTVEERGLLHPDGVDAPTRELYADGYGLRRQRERSAKRSAHDRHTDLWESAKIVFRSLATGEPRLGLPALAGLFDASQCSHLDVSRLENRAWLLAVFKLSWLRDAAGLSRVNWRDMGPEELGSVYESLLELVPTISVASRTFTFATGDETRGNARKTSGSYYTPDSLVQVLLDSALEPVITETVQKHPEDAASALLTLSIVDPACGSGHFLLAAARRLAAHVARLQANGTPSAAQYRHALRQVVGRCIYGVDLNPMAVELCKVALWMEAVEPGLPLSFLDAHVRHGNALLGTTPELMAKGIPDAAWEPIEGDDKKLASLLKKRNSQETRGQGTLMALWSSPAASEADAVASAVAALDAAPDADVAAIGAKHTRYAELLTSIAYRRQKFLADAWCAAFVWPKPAERGAIVDVAPTQGMWTDLRDGRGHPSPLMAETVQALADQYHFFHWHLAFPTVFARGGFDVVLGNPPWERVKLQEQEFFASRSEAISGAVNAAARKKLIAALPDTDPALWTQWSLASRAAEGQSHFVRQSQRFPLCGKGDVNTYALFAEHNRSVLSPTGRAGFIVPTGIATDDTTKDFFCTLVAGSELLIFYHFENEEFVFPGVHHAFKFALMGIDRSGRCGDADLVFFARQISALADQDRHVSLSATDFDTLNPNTGTCPTFRSRRDAVINLAMYRRSGVFWRESDSAGNVWGIRFLRMFDMANDSSLFVSRSSLADQVDRYLPLIEAKMIHHYDHRFGTYEGQTQAGLNQGKLPELDDESHANPSHMTVPNYWLERHEVASRLADRWSRGWLLGWRDICRSTDQRTVIASLIPLSAVGHTTPLMLSGHPPDLQACMYANLCSFALDYAARQKVGGTHLTYSYLKQLPVLAAETYTKSMAWHAPSTALDFILPRVLELTYTAWDLQPFAQDVGCDGPPFRWDPARRFLLRAELDAAFFHLYGLSRDDTDYIMDTFPIVRKNDEKAHGDYRTKRVILEVYDAMATAARTGDPYVTRLDPPPADSRVAHPPRPPEPAL